VHIVEVTSLEMKIKKVERGSIREAQVMKWVHKYNSNDRVEKNNRIWLN